MDIAELINQNKYKNIHKEGLIMADQTLPLNVSDEMKLDDERQNCVGMESNEELCSSSSDSAEELYSSSAIDAYREYGVDTKD